MKSTLSTTLVLCLVTSTLSVGAQDRMESAPGPIARAVAWEAVQLTGDRQAASTDIEWSRVRKLAPGSEIILTIKGSPPGDRYVVRADGSDLTVSNVAYPGLPAAAKDVLRGVAADHPEYFLTAQRGGTIVLEKSLRLGRDGVFASDRKVADIGQVVETIARNDVADIRARRKGRGVWGFLGPLGGYFVGAMSGGYVAGFACQAAAGPDRCDTGAFLTGMVVGGIVGGGYGIRAANRETEDVIYHAP
jgi:hypothetical protein